MATMMMNTHTAYAAAQSAIATAVRTAPAAAICVILTTAGALSIVKRDGRYLVVDAAEATVGTYETLIAAHTAAHAA